MRNQFILLLLLVPFVLLGQDSVDVTFRYKASATAVKVFLPGEFNNWGPNASGIISPTAPSAMTLENSIYYKTIRLAVGGGTTIINGVKCYQYKMHEHYNATGTTNSWLSDPINPNKNAADNNNSYIIVKSPMIFQIEPTSTKLLRYDEPAVTVQVSAKVGETIDTQASKVFINDILAGSFGAYFNQTKQILFVPSISVFGKKLSSGLNEIKIVAVTNTGATTVDSLNVNYVINPPIVNEKVPVGIVNGINYGADPTKVTLCLFAPYKKFVYVIGDFNDWTVTSNYFMKRDSVDANNTRWWITIDGLQAAKEYAFQYLIDDNLVIADPFADKLLHPDDSYIPAITYPNLKAYPTNRTSEYVSVFQTAQTQYQWQTTNYQRPKNTDLVAYELLLRDFVARHDYQTLTDSLPYLKRLGINAIQLMPIMEFEGNESWGYNPAFFFAPDKYYGTKNDLKKLVDKAHENGIAIILDIALNHSFGQSPLVRLYWDAAQNRPAANNPWFNTAAKHAYNVGMDFNHESQATKDLVDRVLKYWMTEFKVDGFRFDLSKGFTQKPTCDINGGSCNVGAWGAYDQSRIDLLKRMSVEARKTDSTSFLILEHFADNNEEKVLSDNGFMLWGNMNFNYNEATMGWNDNGKSNFSGVSYKSRSWTNPLLVGYMESHDEERLMYKNEMYGNVSGAYSIKDLATGLNRMKLAAAFFFTIPGPKMIWQFGERGYDLSINYPSGTSDSRLANKPPRWEYMSDARRSNLFKVYSSLIKLKENYPAFESNNFTMDVAGAVKKISILDASMDVSIVGNFDLSYQSVPMNFSKPGRWYRYFENDSIEVSDVNQSVALAPGEFFIYTTAKLPNQENGIVTDVEEFQDQIAYSFALEQNYPNPFNPTTSIKFNISEPGFVSLKIYDVLGNELVTLVNEVQSAGTYKVGFDATAFSSGVYFYQLRQNNSVITKKMVLVK
ncbi:MAG: alpha-amylase family glycosyl hydrolase [Ignavibacteriaceae bacterium]|nr:alpha-amylase family glycosyl hydrolase [Ignavibacteriaceae bacterium]